ncbi:MAG: ABC transporter permease subunit [Lentilactobacillus hilgardii]|uniref:PhnE/PtxC family ABC transporter permease n=1 Tax=Lentilactobacillus hilgardii TaxID=1588 RepID=UPI001CC1D282|nr:ABC transporter permease subunit [Lentilactobacillus hilgardii]MBZ2201733.1 ABC transporter permease [Lentilactobacillus hilgardii]MBZ2204640.1 ABC transporter permease [Lentilactobacillus hilgardii]
MISKPEKRLEMMPVAPVIPKLNFSFRLKDKRRRTIYGVIVLLFLTTALTIPTIIPKGVNLTAATKGLLENFRIMLFHPAPSNTTMGSLLGALVQSISLAFLTTLIGAVIAFFIALMASRNLAPRWLIDSVQSVMALIRAIPTILWVLIYSVALGLGANAAVIGLTFHSVAYLVKVYADSIDEISKDSLASLRAMGVGFWPLVSQVILPSVMPSFLSWTFIRFEINFANAVAVGAAAGAGGIGYQLFMASGFYFDFHEVGMIVYLILAFTIPLEIVSYKLRTKYIKRATK